MLRLPSLLFALLTLTSLSAATTTTTLTFHLPAHHPPPTSPHTALTCTTLDQPPYHTLLTRSNTFTLTNITSGSYLCEVHSLEYIFHPLRVDVHPDGTVQTYFTFRGNAWSNTGELKRGEEEGNSNRVELLPVQPGSGGQNAPGWTQEGKIEFYVKREGFSPMKLLGSPMILIALVSLGGVMLVPKLIDQMDPEMRAEFEREQAKGIFGGAGNAAAQNPLANFDMASFLAGKTAPGAAATASEETQRQPHRGAGARRK